MLMERMNWAMRPSISPPSMILASKCGRINMNQCQNLAYFQFIEFIILLLSNHTSITISSLSLSQEKFICNKYARPLNHSFIYRYYYYYYFIIYFTKESFNRLAFFFNKCLFNLKNDNKTRNKKERKKKVDAYGIGLAAAKEEEPETEVGKPRAEEEKAQEGKSASSSLSGNSTSTFSIILLIVGGAPFFFIDSLYFFCNSSWNCTTYRLIKVY